ncbi:MAG TPA: ester cyclase [Euzebyales bacterium]|nr:ester cyclase [Euzebyales bacterium]
MASPADDNVRRHREQFRAYNRHDVDAMVQGNAPDSTITDHALGQTITGHDEIRAYVQANFDQSSDNQLEEVEIVGAGDWTVGRFVSAGTHDGSGGGIEPTGLPTRISICSVARWRDGKVVEEHLYYDLYGWLAQVGQVPALADAT